MQYMVVNSSRKVPKEEGVIDINGNVVIGDYLEIHNPNENILLKVKYICHRNGENSQLYCEQIYGSLGMMKIHAAGGLIGGIKNINIQNEVNSETFEALIRQLVSLGPDYPASSTTRGIVPNDEVALKRVGDEIAQLVARDDDAVVLMRYAMDIANIIFGENVHPRIARHWYGIRGFSS